jgi:hypothetical protein
MRKRLAFSVTVGFVSALALVAAGLGSSIRLLGASQQPTPSAQTGQLPQPDMTEMMKQHQQLMADMKAGDAKLDELVATMNAATGEAKVSAMAQVVNELVRQQKAMHEHMGAMMMRSMMKVR